MGGDGGGGGGGGTGVGDSLFYLGFTFYTAWGTIGDPKIQEVSS